MRRRVAVVGSICLSVCVCASVKSHLTSGASVRPENTVTYSVGNGSKVKNLCGFSETAPLQRSSTTSVDRPYAQSAILTLYITVLAFSLVFTP